MKFQDLDIMIVSLAYGGIETETVNCTAKLYEYSKWLAPHTDKRLPVNNVEWRFIKSTTPSWSRNAAAKVFLESNAKSLLMLDRDHLFHHTYLQTLIEADKNIIAGVYTTKHESIDEVGKGIAPVVSRKVGDKIKGYTQQEFLDLIDSSKGEPFPVDLVGMGLILFKRKVFETIPQPWFCQPESNFDDNDDGCCGEDYYFINKAQKYGFKTYVHPLCFCLHIGKGWYGIGNK